ncbi:AtpZ/AtpI family protein [Candidatus Peregrinibacteria bacterium]|nr:MAG: AtpZ/AtpI family protein [Candidatus Peregrinibacteria bacterium]
MSLTTLTSILIFAGGGHWLDLRFDKHPWFMVLGLMLSFPVTQLSLYRLMKRLANQQNNSTQK